MALEMVDGNQGKIRGQRQSLGRGQSDQQSAQQAWTGGSGNAVEIV
jgi:hypothetical protein